MQGNAKLCIVPLLFSVKEDPHFVGSKIAAGGSKSLLYWWTDIDQPRTPKDMSLLSRTQTFDQDESDSELMTRVVSQDESALAALYDRYSGPVYSLLRRILHDESAAEEILQDVFLHLWRIAPRFDQSRGELRGWLLVIARNRALSHLRRRTLAETDDVERYAVSGAAAQDTVAAQGQLVAKVRRALEELPREMYALFEMAYFEGMTHSEIAKRTGQPLGTVKTRLRSTLTNLRRGFQL